MFQLCLKAIGEGKKEEQKKERIKKKVPFFVPFFAFQKQMKNALRMN